MSAVALHRPWQPLTRIARAIRATVTTLTGLTLTSPDLYKHINPYFDEKLGITVNTFTAMQLDAVWACVRLIAETISTLPLAMYEKISDRRKRYASEHPLHFLLHDQPNGETTAAVFWEAMVASMLLRGCGRAEKLMIGERTVGLVFLDPALLQIDRDPVTRRKRYLYPRNPEASGGALDTREIPATNIWEIPGFTLNGKDGVSVIAYGAKVFGGAIAAERAAARTFANGLLQTVYYKVKDWLKPAQRTEFHENVLGTVERGETPLLENGIEPGTIGIKPEEAQLLASRGYGVEMICRWFRVPPWMVGHTEKSTSWGTGIEQQMIGFLTFTLMPWLRRIEQAINKDLVPKAQKGRFYAKFNYNGLLRADSAARAAFYVQLINNSVMTPDEARELEELEPMGGNAAKLRVQSSMVLLDDLGDAGSEQLNEARDVLRALLNIDIKEPA